MVEPAAHYRAPMRSRSDDVPEQAGVERGLSLQLCGIGGRLERAPADLAEALAETEAAYDLRTARRLLRFTQVPDGAVVWTRDGHGGYHRGELAGGWRYDESPGAADADLVHVRPCCWRPVDDDAVPEAVLATFRRGGRNFQAIHSRRVEIDDRHA